MRESEVEARQACIDMIDALVNDHKKSISKLEIMKEHVNDMSSEMFERFALVFGYSMAPDMTRTTLKATATICEVNETIEHIKEEEE